MPVAGVLEVHKWRREGRFTVPDVFQRSAYRMFYNLAGIDVIARGPREKGTYACVGCTLAMTMDQGFS